MKKIGMLILVAVASAAFSADVDAHGRHTDRRAARHAQGLPWNAPYFHTSTGTPISMVVPPVAHMQTKWGWGVSGGSMTPIYHQFRRPYMGGAELGGGEVSGTPAWPSHSDQFGVYYIRGPW